jgi:hypothetical protein
VSGFSCPTTRDARPRSSGADLGFTLPLGTASQAPRLLRCLLFGFFAGNVIVFLELGGLFVGGFGITSISIWEGLLAAVAGGCAFGVVLGFASYWMAGWDHFKMFCLFVLAGGVAGTAAWMIAQPDTSIIVAIGANAILSGLYYLVSVKFG